MFFTHRNKQHVGTKNSEELCIITDNPSWVLNSQFPI